MDLIALLGGGTFLALYSSFVFSLSSSNSKHEVVPTITLSKNHFGKNLPKEVEIDGFW